MAFGTGLHPTTRMALRLLLDRVARGDVVLDIGCGSGILGIAAALRGTLVYASDSDEIAVNATRANFAANGLRARRILHASDVPASFPQAHTIVANMTGRVLARLAPSLASKLVLGGSLITSGVVAGGKDELLAALAQAGLKRETVLTQGEWFAFAHRKPQR
jgi:ribosomal protein L11 methyltransferase